MADRDLKRIATGIEVSPNHHKARRSPGNLQRLRHLWAGASCRDIHDRAINRYPKSPLDLLKDHGMGVTWLIDQIRKLRQQIDIVIGQDQVGAELPTNTANVIPRGTHRRLQ